MKLVNHGGKCCGIRHIYHFPARVENQTGVIAHDRSLVGAGVTRSGVEALDMLLEHFETTENRTGGFGHGDRESRVLEVVLTDSQTRVWGTTLEERRFRKVVRFQNDNTGNFCNVYHRYNDPDRYQVIDATMAATVPAPAIPDVRAPAPLNPRTVPNVRVPGIEGVVDVEVHADGSVNFYQPGTNIFAQRASGFVTIDRGDIRQERRVVMTTYHCVYRDGRRGAGYDSEQDARTANPRVRTVVSRNIFNDGSGEWSDNND